MFFLPEHSRPFGGDGFRTEQSRKLVCFIRLVLGSLLLAAEAIQRLGLTEFGEVTGRPGAEVLRAQSENQVLTTMEIKNEMRRIDDNKAREA